MAQSADAGLSKSSGQLTKEQVEALEARRMFLLRTLDLAFAPALIARALAAVGLTAHDLAVATGAHVRTASSWLDEAKPEPKIKVHRERLQALKRVTRFIVDDGTVSYQEADWLREPNGRADLKTPLDLVGEGKWKQAGQLYCDDVAVSVPSMFFPTQDEIEARQHDENVRIR